MPDRAVALGRVVEEVNRRAGTDLTFLGIAELGETNGAAFVMWPDGRRSVVTLATVPFAAARQAAEVLEAARTQGLPVPRLELVIDLVDGRGDEVVAVVQERLPGNHPNTVDADVIDRLTEVNDAFAGLLIGRPDVTIPPLYLAGSGPVFPRHETLESYDERSRRLLRWIHDVGRRSPNEMSGHDLIHPDFTVSNVLFDDAGDVGGVVDWNGGVLRGDRRFALVKLLFDLSWEAAAPDGGRHHVQPAAIERLDAFLQDTVAADVLEMYWAHWTLTMLHWTIGSGDRAVIELHLGLGERGLERAT